MNEFSRAGVVVLADDVCASWRQHASRLLEIVADHHKTSDYTQIGTLEPARADDLRRDILGAAPGLEEFITGVRKDLARNCAVFVPGLGIGEKSASERATIAYAVSVCLGNPTATDKKQVVWDVKARQRDSTYFSTFSETDGEAEYHTDTQYFPDPEPQFCLYVVEEARCHGGYSSVLDARALRGSIEKSKPWLADFLTKTQLPFRVPSAFASAQSPDVVEVTLAPVFSDSPYVRYRRDTLDQGMHHFPEFRTRDADEALAAFERELANCPYQAEFFMPRDSMIFIDNHRCLHARTAFQDHQRHLLRIRSMHIEPHLAQPKGKYTMMVRQLEPGRPLYA